MANKVYQVDERALVWTDSGGDYALDLGGLATNTVRVGAQGDLGASPRAFRYFWQIVIDGFDSAPTVAEDVHIYLSFANDATDIDGDVGASDAAGAVADLPNLLHIGTVVVQTTTAGDELITSGIVEIGSRYVSPVIHNNTAVTLLSTADAHTFTLTPIPYEIQ
jgi:hypothetical protein